MNDYSNQLTDNYIRYAKVQINQYKSPVNSITIDTERHTLTLYKDGKVAKVYPVAVGKPTTPTPKGNFTIAKKISNPGGPFGVYWLGLSIPHYGIHGTNNPSSIGKSVSHGCIRMFNQDVLELNKLAPIGTPVKII